ncbi:MAG TPA: ABC transporter substrate-binding protein [Actinomycetota bacterium]|nr:ABC transporter substrate-binding protein [Actinomycetota bacterium]
MDQRRRGRHLSRRDFIAATGLAGAGLLLARCGGTSTPTQTAGRFGTGSGYDGPKVSLEFWNGFTGGDGPVMKELIERFNSETDNVEISMRVLEWADYYTKVPQAVASGRGPDLGVMHIDQLATNAARNVILPLDEVAEVLELEEGDFAPEVWTAGIYNDQRYGIPLDVHPLGFYYNRAHLEEAGISQPPQTAADYEDAIKALQDAGHETPFWVTATWPAHLMFASLLWQFGGELYSEDAAEATFNSDAGVEALSWLVQNVENGYSPKDVANDAQAVAFRNQENSLTWDGIWMINEWAKVGDLEWGVAPLPTIGDQAGVWGSSHNIVVMRQAEQDDNKLQAAKAFIAWLSEHSIEWAKAGQIPARNSVRESDEFQQLDAQSTLAAQLPAVHFPPAVPGIGEITTPTFETAVNEAVLMRKSPKVALDEAASRANDLLEENRQKYGS